ncbi:MULTISPECIES: type I methionyl aminopeptidase [unclassified Modicisalibacter]|uniref:type I methionyl aminopeptidase n=1 Tax=unclassified Modicisalibacter TaxID=2679913 RepID=UPI001CCD8813|nr:MULTISPECIES: type I methionyl aminopeptidase [unclassified Modicisalibacter]MBZ9558135.1 type I methionyl aminopeptidase [Modicisalibacter sp. R2A 31.J]MBZ9573196.1 type I methionyl aminopeptidase [Modicisalibacter sp. MOD 31.J]
MNVPINTPDDIEKLKIAGRCAAQVLEMIAEHVRPGISTGEIDKLCQDYLEQELGCVSATIGYHGYQHATCISLNHVVCHGIPDFSKVLKKGDIFNIDVTVIKDGYYGDTSRMFVVGENIKGERLSQVTQECLYKSLAIVKEGTRLSDIGKTIQAHAEDNGYSVVRDFCGHGIGKNFHEEPQVLHYDGYEPHNDLVLEEGMCLTIEPMINAGKHQTKVLKDGWTAVTRDKSLSAQWEHTLVVTKDGCIVTTARHDEDLAFLDG